ncbi:protein FAM133-like [Penaeus chinensis]|uniref:protein FAM133-like n=1 Tax=Penaeus chinensis TaxID=139456 RepID=UPI001FB7EDAF|nr:protein FAM133-like [Penaeus chinensis]
MEDVLEDNKSKDKNGNVERESQKKEDNVIKSRNEENDKNQTKEFDTNEEHKTKEVEKKTKEGNETNTDKATDSEKTDDSTKEKNGYPERETKQPGDKHEEKKRNADLPQPPIGEKQLKESRRVVAALNQQLRGKRPVRRQLWEVDHVKLDMDLEAELEQAEEEDSSRFRETWEELPPQRLSDAPRCYHSQVRFKKIYKIDKLMNG